jgi:hypothetical protein
MTVETVPAAEPADRPLDLFDFFEGVRTTNPFLNNRVDRPLDPSLTDVESIHEAAFSRIVNLGAQAQAGDRGLGVVVWGEAGMGKTHLLARLARWAGEGRKAHWVYLHNPQASPGRLPRTVLRATLHRLTRGQVRPFSRSPLWGLVDVALKRELWVNGKVPVTWPQVEAAYADLVARLAADDPTGGGLFDPTVYDVLLRFYRSAYPSRSGGAEDLAALVVSWLSGEVLDPADARRLGLPPGRNATERVGLEDNQHVKQVLVALTQLARVGGRQFLLCLDQVDNLDEEQVRSLSRFLHDLLDSAGNLLVVTTGVRQTLLGFLKRGVITETSWDRIGQFEIALGRLRREQGWELLRKRLLKFLEPFRGLKEVEERLRDDPLFPLGVAWFDARLRDLPDFRPRDLLGWACDRWQRLQEELTATTGETWLGRWDRDTRPPEQPPVDLQAVVDRAVADRMAEHQARGLKEPDSVPADEDHLASLLEDSLKQCLGGKYRLQAVQRLPLPRSGPRPTYDLLVEQSSPSGGPPLRIGVRVLVAEHARTVTNALERFVEDEEPPGRILLVTDERRDLRLGGKGSELLAELAGRGPQKFRHFRLSLRHLANLDALQKVVRLARSGDFEVGVAPGQRRALAEEEVIASHHRAGRYLEHPLLNELLGGPAAAPSAAPTAPPVPAAALDEKDVRQFLMAQVAANGTLSLGELAERYAALRSAEGRPGLEAGACKAALRPIAQRLSDEGRLRLVLEGDRVLLARAEPQPAAP